MKKAPVVVLEGTWWSNHEVPQVLPYFEALSTSYRQIDFSYRTIRKNDDIAYYVSRISKGSEALLYIACHGENKELVPSNNKDRIQEHQLLEALGEAKTGAISYIHYGCCEMIDTDDRRACHGRIMDATGAIWSSGYTQYVDWFRSMFLDLAIIKEVFISQHSTIDGRKSQPKKTATTFFNDYNQLSRSLGFSALMKVSNGYELLPNRLQSQ